MTKKDKITINITMQIRLMNNDFCFWTLKCCVLNTFDFSIFAFLYFSIFVFSLN